MVKLFLLELLWSVKSHFVIHISLPPFPLGLSLAAYQSCFFTGNLDLRMDEPTEVPKVPSASEILQHLDERGLIRILKGYGNLKSKARFVADAILEARYLFHCFKTNQVRHKTELLTNENPNIDNIFRLPEPVVWQI